MFRSQNAGGTLGHLPKIFSKMEQHFFISKKPLITENGFFLPEFELFYSTLGKLNSEKNNVVWVCHALTANSDVSDWWNGLIETWFPPEKYFIICANMLASCYGSTSPLSVNPLTGKPFYHDFPILTAKDMVNAFHALAESLDIQQINLCIGGSTGGQHALEWAAAKTDFIKNLLVIACGAKQSPWAIAFNETQRMAIESDATWRQNSPEAGATGMMTARALALLSYRNYETYLYAQSDEEEKNDQFRASSYQRYQGEKLRKRFNAFSYWHLTKIMDSHDVGRGRGGVKAALQKITAKTLSVGITSDILFPPSEQIFIAKNVPAGTYVEIQSRYGHDGFLLENEKLTNVFREWYENRTFL
jgi:homoserine O-acetyltransferase